MTAEFTVENVSKQEVKLLGVETSCSCTSCTNEFPVALSPGQETKIHIRVAIEAGTPGGRFIKSARLFVDRKGTVPLFPRG